MLVVGLLGAYSQRRQAADQAQATIVDREIRWVEQPDGTWLQEPTGRVKRPDGTITHEDATSSARETQSSVEAMANGALDYIGGIARVWLWLGLACGLILIGILIGSAR